MNSVRMYVEVEEICGDCETSTAEHCSICGGCLDPRSPATCDGDCT